MVAWCRRRRAGNAGIVRALFNRQGVAIAGRDGTLVQSGGTGSTALHPTYGSVQSSGALISHNLAIPGVGTLPMSFAQGARTNLCPAVTFNSSLNSNNYSGVSRTLTESTANSTHRARGVSAAVAATSYKIRATLSPIGSRSMAVVIRDNDGVGANEAGITRLADGTVSLTVAGSGAATGLVTRETAIGTYVEATVSLAVIVTNVVVQERLGDAAGSFSYLGDGVSGGVFIGVTLENATFSGLGLAEGATRAADNILWTPPSALSTVSGEVVAIAAPYLWSAGAGAAHPSAANARRWDYLNGSEYDFRGATEGPQRRDVGAQTAFIASLADSSGSLRMTSAKWDASSLGFYRGATLAASDAALTPPWVATPNMNIGATSTPSSHWFGFVGLIYVPGGLTDAERIALASVTGGSLTYVG